MFKLLTKCKVDIIPPKTTKQQVRAARGIFYQPKKVTDAVKLIHRAFSPYKIKELSAMPIKISIKYVWAYPVSWPKRLKNGKEYPHPQKPDFDNASKLFCDALDGLFWIDDKQIFSGTMEKYYGESPYIEVEIYEYHPDQE